MVDDNENNVIWRTIILSHGINKYLASCRKMKFTTTLAMNGKSILRTMANDPHCFSLKY